jgi:hypothetical protein
VADEQAFKHIEDQGENTDKDEDCGVPEEFFPWLGKCCLRTGSPASGIFREKCLHCSIWSSLPDGGDLTITHILECARYGYGKRIKE